MKSQIVSTWLVRNGVITCNGRDESEKALAIERMKQGRLRGIRKAAERLRGGAKGTSGSESDHDE